MGRRAILMGVSLAGLLVACSRPATTTSAATPPSGGVALASTETRTPQSAAPIVVGGDGPSETLTDGTVPSGMIPHPRPGLWEIEMTSSSEGQEDVVRRGQVCIGAPGDRVLAPNCPTGRLQRTPTGGYIVALSCNSGGETSTIVLHSEGDYVTNWIEDTATGDGAQRDHVVRRRVGPCPAGAAAYPF